MKKFLLMALLLCGSTVMFSQRPGGGPGGGQFSPEDFAKRQTEWMTKELNLTDAQIAPVDSVNLLYAKKQQELFKPDGDREAMREAMQTINAEKEAAFAKILTEEQFKTYKEKSREMFGRRGNGENRPPRPRDN
ncbi:MAG: DUF4890 domain-containing protein [Dysgonamonadaceae bacterium]|jgi:Spy/CpxP family protein refolding chaperone|nr:DUF4890 domain-containing protein [Dysgonamonadaceae bacterium]